MNKVIRVLRRAAQASPHEWYTRAGQLLYACRNLAATQSGATALPARGHLRALQLNERDLSDWWGGRRTQWFLDEQRVQRLTVAAQAEASQLPWVLQQADKVLVDELTLFSYAPVHYVDPHRWHRDFIGKKTAPRKFHGLVPYLNPDVVGDSKHTWEPNRFAWAVWLGIAFRITGEIKYAEKFRQLTLDWFRSNPYPIGINYCSSLELAFRNYAWLWSLALFSKFLKTQDELLNELLRGIWIGTRHIEQNLSTYFAPNTHITGEAFGLFAVGAAIPEFRDAARWRSLGASLLESEAKKQFYQDGMHRELSSGYHLYSSDFYLQTVLISRESGFRIPPRIEDTAQRAAHRLAELIPESLIIPAFNDCDGGQVLRLVPNALDAGPALMAAEAMFPSESFLDQEQVLRGYPLLMASPEETSHSQLRRKRITMAVDRDLQPVYDSGIASHRTNAGDFLLFRASDFGYHDRPHSHDAGLGIILELGRTPIFVDSGVGSYTQSESCRNRFRGATGKNTILVNGNGPSVPDGWFSWQKVTDAELLSLRRYRDGFVARGKHSGFSDSPDSHAFVQRKVIMLNEGIIAIIDRWDSDTSIDVEARFTLNPQLTVDAAHNVLISPDENVFHFSAKSLIAGEEIEFVHNKEPYSANYGLVSETNAISCRHPKSARGGMVTFVSRCGPSRCQAQRVSFEVDDVEVQFEVHPSDVRLLGRAATTD